jgi:hypothetical protein
VIVKRKIANLRVNINVSWVEYQHECRKPCAKTYKNRFYMILVGQIVGKKMAIVYNTRFDAVFGTRGFNLLPRPNKRARG